jgi:hypothetical protein
LATLIEGATYLVAPSSCIRLAAILTELPEVNVTKTSGISRRSGSLDESVTDLERRQQDMLDLLQRSSHDPVSYVGLAYCGPERCCRVGCSEACVFGCLQRRSHHLPAIRHLLERHEGPLHEVRVLLPSWSRSFGALSRINMATARQLHRRALDRLFNPTLIAVGSLKVVPNYNWKEWNVEIHLIVAGAKKNELEKVFSIHRLGKEKEVRVTRVDHLGTAIEGATDGTLQPRRQGLARVPPKKAQRAEFYRWLSELEVDSRLIRYGCDRHFNPLTKKPRTLKAKPRKKRPYPTWLTPWMFGVNLERDEEVNSMTYIPAKKPVPGDRVRVVTRGPDYYNEE